MLKLSLLRHAKSSWDDPDLGDHERPLSKRGTKAAASMGRYIAEHDLVPELILCSDAIRTRATLALVLNALQPPAPKTVMTDKLYLASPAKILDTLKSEAGTTNHVMIIGHNPGMHALALSLPATGKKSDLASLSLKYPTAALAHISFDLSDWDDVATATGKLERYVVPRALPQ